MPTRYDVVEPTLNTHVYKTLQISITEANVCLVTEKAVIFLDREQAKRLHDMLDAQYGFCD